VGRQAYAHRSDGGYWVSWSEPFSINANARNTSERSILDTQMPTKHRWDVAGIVRPDSRLGYGYFTVR
jgi:hypothetical protein